MKFFEFEDGIYLIDGEENYKDYWGQKLIAINGYEIEEVKEMIKPYIQRIIVLYLKTIFKLINKFKFVKFQWNS